MNPIEAAAREIAATQRARNGRPLGEKRIIEIIARHLFPQVKAEEVVFGESYWFRTGSKWECGQAYNDLARRRRIVDECDAIYGPIPMPEVRS